MKKALAFKIKESVLDLKKLKSQQKSITKEKRVLSLLHLKNNTYRTRQELANSLSIHIRTLERWYNSYKEGGIDSLLNDKPKNKVSKIITNEMHLFLSERVNNPHTPFLGYWDAQNTINKEFNTNVKYHRIREYLIQHFSTKLKTPRKSHVNKREEEYSSFLKTT